DLCHETLLHLTMRWGLLNLSHYFISLPGGRAALTRVNTEGETPVELAIRNGHSTLVHLLSNSQDIPPLDFFTAPINQNSFLRFCRTSGVLTLTRREASGDSVESDIGLFRKCLCDTNFFEKIVGPVYSWNHMKQVPVIETKSEGVSPDDALRDHVQKCCRSLGEVLDAKSTILHSTLPPGMCDVD
ncbi:PREDICTED: rho guanine nucleotide exchange factor 28-like, partial [Nanorana parkeri]|uniref:rho guanine nucleotide exchange factor 28-like n=1 Tax=Nanorana parkeri TaxID=125878 RepID=UPI0008541221